MRQARNAFKAVGKKLVEKKKGAGFEYVESKFVNMSLKEAVWDRMGVEALFEHFKRVDVAEIRAMDEEMRTGKLGEFVVFACLVKKIAKKESKNGGMYAVWSVCNMPRGTLSNGAVVEPTVVTLLLFEDAFRAFHTRTEGSVFAFRKPRLLPPRGGVGGAAESVGEGGRAAFSGHCLRVANKEQVIYIGVCKDFKLCEAPAPNLSVCANWYDANRMGMCPRHALKKRKNMTGGRRMDVNNAERPGLPDVSIRRNIEPPRNISLPLPSVAGDEARAALEPVDEEAEWRKRKEAGIVRKLNRKRVRVGVAETGKASLSEMVAKRKRRVHTPMRKDVANPFVKDPKSINAEQERGEKTTGGETLNTKEMREKAIAVLLDCGYVLEKDGTLRPPGWKDTAEREQRTSRQSEEEKTTATKSSLVEAKSGAEGHPHTEVLAISGDNRQPGRREEKDAAANVHSDREARDKEAKVPRQVGNGSARCTGEGHNKLLELSDESDESGDE